MKYAATYTELLGMTVIVDVDSKEEAMEKVLAAVQEEDIVLTTDDYVEGSGTVNWWHADTDDMELYPALESFTD